MVDNNRATALTLGGLHGPPAGLGGTRDTHVPINSLMLRRANARRLAVEERLRINNNKAADGRHGLANAAPVDARRVQKGQHPQSLLYVA